MTRETIQRESQGYISQVRLAGLGLVKRVQEESARLFEALVEEGQKAQEKPQESIQASAPNALKALGDTLLDQAQELEERAKASLARFLNRLGLPSSDEVQALSRRVDELEQSLQELGVIRKPEPHARKTAVVKAVKTA